MVTYPSVQAGQQWRDMSAAEWRFLVEQVKKALNFQVGPGLSLRHMGDGMHLNLAPQAMPALLFAERFIVQSADDYPDTIACTMDAGDTGIVHIARPYLLRRTPFDNKSRGDISYLYLSNVWRLASKDDATGEQQVIIPSYRQGDFIYAVRGVARGTQNYALVPGGDRSIHGEWIDLNVDGRFWARKAGNGSE